MDPAWPIIGKINKGSFRFLIKKKACQLIRMGRLFNLGIR
jgi:hypothetical protein